LRQRIVCIEREPVFLPKHHPHVVRVGTGLEQGTPSRLWTVDEVIEAFARGDSFFTRSPSTDRIARIEIVACEVCGRRILRSGTDAMIDNDLDELSECG
jgi:hypothetical protein